MISYQEKHDNITDNNGIMKIYQTENHGREWYFNESSPFNDKSLSFAYLTQALKKQPDNAWRAEGKEVKINVNSTLDEKQWKNVEITGYAKIISAFNDNDNITTSDDVVDDDLEIGWISRSGKHTSEDPCDGTAYIGSIDSNGTVSWKKEIWHTGGYTDERSKLKIADSIIGRWIGWKTVTYNTDNDTAVKLESYIDNKNDNYWIKVADVIDDKNWNAKASDKEFNKAECGRDKDYVILSDRPWVTFRSDNIIWEFKNLSIREINPLEKIYNPP